MPPEPQTPFSARPPVRGAELCSVRLRVLQIPWTEAAVRRWPQGQPPFEPQPISAQAGAGPTFSQLHKGPPNPIQDLIGLDHPRPPPPLSPGVG